MEPDKAALRARHATVLSERRTVVRQKLDRILHDNSAAGRPRPLTWEVGSGHGHFLNAYAASHPEKLCIGVDLESDRIVRAEKKRDRAKLPNLHFIHAEARLFLESLPPETRITEVFVLFPDPWPKLRHRKHRILQTAFLTQLAAHAASDCALYFRTDFHPYYLEARATVHTAPEWRLTDETAWPFEHVTVFQSRAERHDSFIARKRAL